MERKAMSVLRDSKTYPLGKNDPLKLKLLISIPVLGNFFLFMTSTLSYNTINPIIFNELGFMSQYIMATLLASLAGNILGPLVGKLGDLFGRRRVLIVLNIIPIIGSILVGIANSLPVLAVGFILCKAAGNSISPITNGLVSDLFDREERPKMFSYQNSLSLLPKVFAPMLGSVVGLAISNQGWYLISTAIFVVSLVLAFMIPKVEQTSPKANAKKIDWIGTVLMQVTVISICVVVGMGGQYFSWGSPIAIALYVLSVVGLIVFVKYESSGKATDPFLDIKIFKSRNYTMALLLTAAISSLMVINTNYLSVYLLNVRGFSSTEVSSGYLLTWVSVIASPIAGTFLAKTGKYRLMLIISTACGMADILIEYIFFFQLGICNIFLLMLVQMCNTLMGATMVGALSTTITNSVSHDKIGIALAMRGFAATISMSLFNAVYSAINNAYGTDIARTYPTVLIIAFVVFVLRFAATMLIDDKAIHSKGNN